MHPFKKTRGQFAMAAKEKTAEILIYDVIGEDPWFGGVGSKDFIQKLAALGDVDSITVRINSPGGDVFEGVAIYNALKTHPATINVQIDSLAASIATVIAMAGDTITISDSAMLMVHNASGVCFGEASDMRQMADLLDKIRAGMMLGAYQRTGKTEAELTTIMDAETWYTAQEALAAGWVDSITEVTPKKAAARAKFDLSAYKHPPAALKAVTCTCACAPCIEGDCASCDDAGCTCEGCMCDSASGTTAKVDDSALKQQESAGKEQIALLSAKFRSENLRLADLG